MSKIKKEASTTASIKGFASSGTPMIKRKRLNVNQPYDESEMFERDVTDSILNVKPFKEVVRKRGNMWVYHDDDTDVEKGVYKDRETAWEKQRIDRRIKTSGKKHTRAERERQKRALVPAVDRPNKAQIAKLAPKAEKEKKVKATRPKKRQKVRKLEAMIREVLNESSMISYVFENTPPTDDSMMWDKFVKMLSRETVMADQELKNTIHNIAKSEARLLNRSLDEVKKILELTGLFTVDRNDLNKDEGGDINLNFTVQLKDSGSKLPFALKIDNGKPLIMFPEQSRDALAKLSNNESKSLRAELMHAQEVSLGQMTDVVEAIKKRNLYFEKLQGRIDKTLGNISPLELAMMKHLIKTKYKGIK